MHAARTSYHRERVSSDCAPFPTPQVNSSTMPSDERNHKSEHPAPEIEERYAKYHPPFDVAKVIRDLIAPIPEKYTRGLRKILMVDTSSLSRRDRTGRVWSRKRKVDMAGVRGRYHYSNGQPWIEIRADQTIEQWKGKSSGGLWIPVVRYLCIGGVFYHELGHHIHRTTRPEFNEKEDVADEWGKKLMGNFFRKRYWYLLPFLLPISWFLRKTNWSPTSRRRN